MTEPFLLEARGLQSFYGASHVLHGVDFRLSKGETVSLIGRNGMGKTTLLRSLVGLLNPRDGEILVDGKAVTGAPPYAIARAGIALVAAIIAVLVRGFGLSVLTQPWNPYLPLLAWLVILLAAWSVLDGDDLMLIPLVVAASFAAQTHIPYLLMAGAIGQLEDRIHVVLDQDHGVIGRELADQFDRSFGLLRAHACHGLV